MNQFINFPLVHYFQSKWLIDSDFNDDRDKMTPRTNLTYQKSANLHADWKRTMFFWVSMQ